MIPLIAQMTIFFQLLSMTDNIHKLAREQRKLDRAIPLVTNIIIKFSNVWSDIGIGAYERGMSYETIDGYNQKMSGMIKELEELTQDFPKMQEILVATRSLQRQQSDLLKRALEKKDVSISNLSDLKKELFSSVLVVKELERLIDEHRTELEYRSQKILQEEEQLKSFLVYGVFLDLFLAILLLALFLNNISSRLRLLVQNAVELPSLKPLSNEVKGSDELAFLDDVLHAASDSLQAAAEQRRTVLEMLAHDMRAPLTNAQLSLEQLRRPDSISADKDRIIQRLKGNHGILISMIDDILTVEELEEGVSELVYEEFKLSSLVKECFEVLDGMASAKKISLVEEVGELHILGDKRKIFRVLLNLLSNAIKFSAPNNKVEVTAKIECQECLIQVRDWGPGIAEQMKERIFDKFFQLSTNTSQGFGLGLAVCKQIILSHGGRIGVESEPGKGSKFWFALPMEG